MQDPPDPATTNGYIRLSADVLRSAFAEWVIYHSPVADRLREMSNRVARNDKGRASRGEWARVGLRKSLSGSPWQRVLRIATGIDPYAFLTSFTIYHEAVGLDPATLIRVLADPEESETLRIRWKVQPALPIVSLERLLSTFPESPPPRLDGFDGPGGDRGNPSLPVVNGLFSDS